MTSTLQIKGLVRLAKVRTQGAQGRLARAQADQRNAEQALADEERKMAEFVNRLAERRQGLLASLLDGPQSAARIARLPLVDAIIQDQLRSADTEVKACRDRVARAVEAVQKRQAEVALQLQKQRKIEIAYEQLAILDLKGAEIAEEMMD